MNKRIRELWYQAVQPHTGDSWAEQTAFMEKFAELIVKECVDYCGENLSKTVGGALKIHFGVEE